MVRGKYFAEFYLVFKTVPDAVDNAELFVQFDGTVNGRAVNVFLQLAGECADAHGAVVGKVGKYGNAAFSCAAPRFFKGVFDFLYAAIHCFLVYVTCDTFAK